MATPFMMSFSRAVVDRLHAEGDLVLSDAATQEAVAEFVAGYLAGLKGRQSLITSLGEALIACPEVDEVFADDDRLKGVVDDIPPAALPRFA